jgi:hypothetical protein
MSDHSAALGGTCRDRFEPLRELFRDKLESHEELGASLAVNIDGEMVVDLWGGWADEARTASWTENTIACVFSTTKTMTALAALVLVDRGELHLDANVAYYWPEFAAQGKARISPAFKTATGPNLDQNIELSRTERWRRADIGAANGHGNASLSPGRPAGLLGRRGRITGNRRRGSPHDVRLCDEQDGAEPGRAHCGVAGPAAVRHRAPLSIENARRKKRIKHGGGRDRQELPASRIVAPQISDDLLRLDAALDRLDEKDHEAAELVKLRYFAGLTIAQAAEILGVSPRKADFLWSFARAWLRREVTDH